MSPGCTTGPPPRHRAASPTLAATFPRPCFDIGELHREPVTAQEWWQALTSTSVPTPAQRATLARRCSCTHVKADHHQFAGHCTVVDELGTYCICAGFTVIET
jgi:hypothetical protein